MLIPFRSNYALVSMILLIKHHCYILNTLSYMHPSIKTSFAPPRETAVVLACSGNSENLGRNLGNLGNFGNLGDAGNPGNPGILGKFGNVENHWLVFIFWLAGILK